jgi:hypothetical protein
MASPQTLESPIIVDTGATGHFLTSNAPHHDQKAAQPGISVLLPDGSQLQSAHTGQIRLPQLPAQACEAHIFPKLASGSLISVEKLCNHGCTAVIDATTFTVGHLDQTLLQGKRSPITKLWTLDLPTEPTTPAMNALVQNPNLADRLAFFHTTMFSPTLSTWCVAVDAGHLTTWPELTSAQVRRHPPSSIAMIKGHFDRNRANAHSTKAKPHSPLTSTTPTKTTNQPTIIPWPMPTSSPQASPRPLSRHTTCSRPANPQQDKFTQIQEQAVS